MGKKQKAAAEPTCSSETLLIGDGPATEVSPQLLPGPTSCVSSNGPKHPVLLTSKEGAAALPRRIPPRAPGRYLPVNRADAGHSVVVTHSLSQESIPDLPGKHGGILAFVLCNFFNDFGCGDLWF